MGGGTSWKMNSIRDSVPISSRLSEHYADAQCLHRRECDVTITNIYMHFYFASVVLKKGTPSRAGGGKGCTQGGQIKFLLRYR